MTTYEHDSASSVDVIPNDPDAERLLLGALYQRQSLIGSLGITADLFWSAPSRRCWMALERLYRRNPSAPFLFSHILDELRVLHARRPVDDLGWLDFSGDAFDAPARLAELRDCAERRRWIDLAHRLVDEAYSPAPLRPWKDSAGRAASTPGAKGATFDV